MDAKDIRHELANVKASYNLMTYLIRHDKVADQQKEEMVRQVQQMEARMRELESTIAELNGPDEDPIAPTPEV
ncbi:MAG TPA: hypothetical protein VFG50_16795 [Rhodothermales bacterium]|nr:hypothetical protein [Rhodothermales bacterium]